jgi:hypothetical protein
VHVAGLRNGAASEAIVWLKKLYMSVHACLCMLSMRVIGSHTMYIVLNCIIEWFPRLYPKSFAFAVHNSETLRDFFDYIIRYTLISTFRFGSGFGEPRTLNRTYPNPN